MIFLEYEQKGGLYMAKYDKRAQQFVEKEMHKHRFKSSKQAVAVGLDEARRAGVKVPEKK